MRIDEYCIISADGIMQLRTTEIVSALVFTFFHIVYTAYCVMPSL